jgi:hypothetical protein
MATDKTTSTTAVATLLTDVAAIDTPNAVTAFDLQVINYHAKKIKARLAKYHA